MFWSVSYFYSLVRKFALINKKISNNEGFENDGMYSDLDELDEQITRN